MKRILILDNNDSFTFNIVDLIRKTGCRNFTILNTADKYANVNKVGNFEKIIISPGQGQPEDFPFILDVLNKYHSSRHFLGICLGHQAIGGFFGASLKNIYPVFHGYSAEINITSESAIFRNIPNKFNAALYHSWVIDNNSVPKNLIITALSGNNYIMAVESTDFPVFGVQFHPESFLSEFGMNILENFINLKS